MTNERRSSVPLSDEDLERAVRARLRAIDPGAAPDQLRERVAIVASRPAPTAWGRTIAAMRRGLAGSLGPAAALMAVAGLIGIAILGIAIDVAGPGATPAPSSARWDGREDPRFVIDDLGWFSPEAVALADRRLAAEYERSGLETTVITRLRLDPFNSESVVPADRDRWKNRDGDSSRDYLVVVTDSSGIGTTAGSNVAVEGGVLTETLIPSSQPKPLSWGMPGVVGGLGAGLTAEDALQSGGTANRDIGLWRLVTGIEVLGANVSMRADAISGEPGATLLTLIQILGPLGGAALLVRRMGRGTGLGSIIRRLIVVLVTVSVLGVPLQALDASRSLRIRDVTAYPLDRKTGVAPIEGSFALQPGGFIVSSIGFVNEGLLPVTIDGFDRGYWSIDFVIPAGLANVGIGGAPAQGRYELVTIPPDGRVHQVMVLYRMATCEYLGLPGTPDAPDGVTALHEAGLVGGPGSPALRGSIFGLSRAISLEDASIITVTVPARCPTG